MRQIDDKWRPDVNESNYMQVLKNLLSKYQFTDEDNSNIDEYADDLNRKMFSKKCTDSCLKANNYNDCIDNCLTKYESANIKFESLYDEFEANLSTYGKNFFKV